MGKIFQTLIFLFILISLALPLASADKFLFDDPEFVLATVKSGENITLRQVCITCTMNNVTSVYSPSGIKVLNNTAMIGDGDGEYTLLFTETDELGRYIVSGIGDKTSPGAMVTWGYTFEVTKSGQNITLANSIIIFLSVGMFFIIAGFLYISSNLVRSIPVKATLIVANFISFLVGLNLISVLIADTFVNNQVITFFDNITAISFILLYGLSVALIVLWIITFIVKILSIKNKNKEERYG